MGLYFVSVMGPGSARVSKLPSSTLEPKEEAIFEGILAELRAIEYATWMNERWWDGGSFDREPSTPYPKAPGTSFGLVPLQGLQGNGGILSEEVEEGLRVDSRDVLRSTREEICRGESEES